MDVAVVGAGRVGTAVAVLLRRAGHTIVAVSGGSSTSARARKYLPRVSVFDHVDAAGAGELVLVSVPDDAVAEMVGEISGGIRGGATVAHLSGSMGLEVLEPAKKKGARILSIHPLQTFPDVDGAIQRLPGCWVAVTAENEDGFALGERLAEDLGANPFRLEGSMRPLYHAAAVFASNYLVATSAIAESLFSMAGVPDPAAAMAPLQRAALDNVQALGPGAALTGPVVRGDATTVERNLEALATHALGSIPAYVELARATLDLAERSGRLARSDRKAIEEVLARWS